MELVEKIQSSASQLFQKFGVKKVSMDEISKELSISKKTLYKCFRDKDSLIESTFYNHFDEIDQAIDKIKINEPHPIRQMMLVCQFVIEKNKLNPLLIYDLRKYHPTIFLKIISKREHQIFSQLLRNIELGQSKGYYLKEIDAKVISRAFSLLAYTVFDPNESAKVQKSPEQILIELVKYHIRGISTPKGLIELENLNWN